MSISTSSLTFLLIFLHRLNTTFLREGINKPPLHSITQISLLLFNRKNKSWVLITIYKIKTSGHEWNNGIDNMYNQMEYMLCGIEEETDKHK